MLRRKGLFSVRRPEDGATAVEFGLVAIVMLVLVIGIIQFAIWFWAYQVGAHAAREGARLGAVDPCNDSAIAARVIDRVGGASEGAPTPSVTRSGSPVKVGDEVTVQVTYSAHDVGPFALPVITKSATARVENVPAAGGC